ncbi:MAG: hypothetical protein ACOX6T_14260 [Myxococcales bacterium]|jgi:hypothetical protein
MAGSTTTSRLVFGRSVALCALATGLAAVASVLLAGPSRLGAMIGVATAALSTGSSLGILKLTFHGGMKRAIAGLAVGFLLRMLMVAAGLLVALSAGGEPLAFAAAFFGLYLAHQSIEIAMLSRRSRPAQLEGKA